MRCEILNHLKKTFVEIFREKIYVDDKLVPVVVRDYPYDKTPCITISGFNRDKGQHRRQQVNIKVPLPKDHHLYDENHPNKRYPHSAEYIVKSYEIDVQVWANDERERALIVDQIFDCLFYCMNFHHDYCVRYDHKTRICSTTGEECASLHHMGYHGLRGQCPNRKKYHPLNIMSANRIIKNSLHISPNYDDDDLSRREPLKHSVIEITFDYERLKIIKSNPTLRVIDTVGVLNKMYSDEYLVKETIRNL